MGPQTGMMPAGLDKGPLVPRGEQAIATGEPGGLIRFIKSAFEADLMTGFEPVTATKSYDLNDVNGVCAFIPVYIHYVVYSHNLSLNIIGGVINREKYHSSCRSWLKDRSIESIMGGDAPGQE